jgi:hypothetical protein
VKLSDIDVLVGHRKVFQEQTAMLQACLNRKGLSVKYGDIYIRDVETLKKVQTILLDAAKKQYDEAKTKLMMLGVTEFPDVPTAK